MAHVKNVYQVSALATDLHTQSTFRRWLTEFISPQALQYLQRLWNKRLAQGNVTMQFALEDSEAFFQKHNWKIAEFHSSMEEAHRLKREMRFAWFFRLLMKLYPKERLEYYFKMDGYALLEQI